MGNAGGSDRQSLLTADTKASERLGKSAVSSRFKRLPKRLQDDYQVDQAHVLGTGFNGSVFKAQHKVNGGSYAVKAFHISGVRGDKLKQLEAEAEIFLSMDHPHVARLVDCYEDEKSLHLVMECMEGGELFERVSKRKRFNEVDASEAVWQMLLAVNYIHSKGIAHRDLKLENFLYEKEETNHLKLIDFGFSHIWEPNTKMALSCGTLSYVAPEVLGGSYTNKCDLWSVGVILFIILSGYMPFSGNEDNMIKAIQNGKYFMKPDRWKDVSEEAKDLVNKLMQRNPSTRLSAEQALKHTFILKHDQKQDDALCKDTADALQQFAKASKFRRACMGVMAWSLTNEERASVRKMFLAMDTSKKGTITMFELKECLTKNCEAFQNLSITDEDITPIFAALDASQNDEIHYSEFLAAMCSTRIAMHDALLETTFQRFDVDQTGFISIDNLKTVLGETFDGAEVEKLIAEADKAGNGTISYEEFISFLKDGNHDENKDEVAEKIIEHGLATSGSLADAAPIGSLAWLKGSLTGKTKRNSNTLPQAGGAKPNDSTPEAREPAPAERSQCCTIA